MKKSATTWLLAVLFLSVGAFSLKADDIANGDFAAGKAYWKGDVKEMPSSLTGKPDPGVIVQMKKDKTTSLYQLFRSKQSHVSYSITLQLSPDFKSFDLPAGGSIGFSVPDLPWPLFITTFGKKWQFCVVQNYSVPKRAIMNEQIQPTSETSKLVTLTGKVPVLATNCETLVLLAFPPGEGSVTVKAISLNPVETDGK